MLTDRQKIILKTIVEEYIKTNEPVGSKALTSKPYLDYSSATIRNEMSFLQKEGYLCNTHTSSGRVPSDIGYKYYVSNLFTRDHDVEEQFPLIDEIFEKNKTDRKAVIEKSLNLLSELTNHTTIASNPSGLSSCIAKIDLVKLTENSAMMLLVTDEGDLQKSIIDLKEGLKYDELLNVIEILNKLMVGKRLSDIKNVLDSDTDFADKLEAFAEYRNELYKSFIEIFDKFSEGDFHLTGSRNVFNQPEFSSVDKVKEFLTFIDKKEIFNSINLDSGGLSITIGCDSRYQVMNECSVISVNYKVSETEYGTVAVIGPRRMQYNRVVPLVEYIAKNMNKYYKK